MPIAQQQQNGLWVLVCKINVHFYSLSLILRYPDNASVTRSNTVLILCLGIISILESEILKFVNQIPGTQVVFAFKILFNFLATFTIIILTKRQVRS